jgi:hypothetical protein
MASRKVPHPERSAAKSKDARSNFSVLIGTLATVVLLISAPARALVITPDYSTSVTSSADAAVVEADFGTIVAQYEAMFTNPITVTVTVDLEAAGANSFLGENVTTQTDSTYTAFRSALSSLSGGNPAAQTLLASLPTGSTFNGFSAMELKLPNAVALGLSTSQAGVSEGTITINSSAGIQFATVDGQVGLDNYNFISVTEHELDEVLGLGSALNGGERNVPSFIMPEDLMRYAPNSTTPSFTLSTSAMAFLSINGGKSDLIQLSQDNTGDYGDFYSPGEHEPSAPCTAHVQNAFSCPGQVPYVTATSVEALALEAMGYDPRFSASPTNTTWTVNCTTGAIAGSGAQTVSTTGTLGALLGTPASPPTVSPAPQPGDVIEITGICVEDVTVRTSNLQLTNRNGPDALSDSDVDGIKGQLEIDGAQQIVITGLALGDFTGTFSFASASDDALLYVHGGATVTVQHTALESSPGLGIYVRRASEVFLMSDHIEDNDSNGIEIITGSKAVLGADDGSLSVLVEGNGGDGVTVDSGSSVVIQSAQINENANRQLAVLGASSAHVTGSAASVALQKCFTAPDTPCGNAVEVWNGSSLRVDDGASVSSVNSSSVETSAILLEGSSTLLAASAQILSPSGPTTIEASDNSVIALAGGNSICSGTCGTGTTGTAITADRVSTLMQVAPAQFGYADLADTIYGGGVMTLQSTADLGMGPIGTGTTPSLTWTTGSAGIDAAQNSSFRLEGGVSITGALSLAQASNGFFNLTNGGTAPNVVSGGVSCPFSAIPASHVAGPTEISPAPTLSTNFFATSAGECLSF